MFVIDAGRYSVEKKLTYGANLTHLGDELPRASEDTDHVLELNRINLMKNLTFFDSKTPHLVSRRGVASTCVAALAQCSEPAVALDRSYPSR